MGKDTYSVYGTITDHNNKPIMGANIFLKPVNEGAVSDKMGNYKFDKLNKGVYILRISHIGYTTVSDTININNNNSFNYKMSPLNQSLNEIVVTDKYSENRKKEETLNIEVLDKKYLLKNQGGSLMKSLERLAGVSTIDIGSGISKPVIRGLSFNRVVVVENNIKHESQQWGADHGLEIDQYAVSDIEIIKGPASLMYGSDAIGGVLNIKKRKLPEINTVGGSLGLTAKSNNNLIGSSAQVYARKNKLYTEFRATILDYADFKVPADSVNIYSYRAPLHKNRIRNSAGEERNVHLSVGYISAGFKNTLHISNVYNKSGFFANAHGLEPLNVDMESHDKSDRDIIYPYQKSNHLKVTNSASAIWGSNKLEADVGLQHNLRQELSQYINHGYMPPQFPDTLDFDSDIEREFEKFVYSANIRYIKQINDFTELKAGADVTFQENKINGRGFIIPAFKQLNTGGFLLLKHSNPEYGIVQLGVRFDYANIKTSEYADWFKSPVVENGDTIQKYLVRSEDTDKSFYNFSWSAGYSYSPEEWSFKLNIGKSFRIPIPKELAANGVNYHYFRYEKGDPELSPETSYQADLGLKYTSEKLIVETSPFFNYFSNYIYLNPGTKHDRLYGIGNQVFNYTQSKVIRYGGELTASYSFYRNFRFGITGEYIYSEQVSGDKKGFTLPFSPPASVIFNLSYENPKILNFENTYISFDFVATAAQKEIVPPEETTSGYGIINISTGGDIKIRKHKINLSLQVKNLLNKKYFNHTSFYRLINVPEPGRNISVNITIPFSGKI